MWPFSKKWSPPAPQVGLVISLANETLPSLVMVANPSGENGAVPGMMGPAEGQPTAENMLKPMQPGQYIAISPSGASYGIQVEKAGADERGLPLEGPMLAVSGLTPEMLAKFNRPVWRVMLRMFAPGKNIQEAVVFATQLGKRLNSLGDGVAMDVSACRFFGPNGWPVEQPMPDFDAREHVQIHIESDSRWYHTHGMVKFGRPEMEIYDVPEALSGTAYATLLDIAQYVVTTAMIEPGQTCGDPKQPFHARAGSKNRKEHWNDQSVIELVDVDERGKPVASGAPKALQFMAK